MPVVAECEPGCECPHVPTWKEVFEDSREAKRAAASHVGRASIRFVDRQVAERIRERKG